MTQIHLTQIHLTKILTRCYVNPICIDEREELVLSMPAFIPNGQIVGRTADTFIAMPISDQCQSKNCFGFIEKDESCQSDFDRSGRGIITLSSYR